MLAPLTKKMTDRSKETHFAFTFYCDVCGQEWRSRPISYSGGENSLPLDSKVKELIWTAEHNAAYERANHEAMTELNHCPACGKWVCQNCFHTRSHSLTDYCVKCLPKE